MPSKRYVFGQRWKRRNAAVKASRSRWGGERFPDVGDGQMETLTLLSAGVCRRVAFRRGKFGRIVMADGTVTTATALAARIRKWLAIGNAPAAGRE